MATTTSTGSIFRSAAERLGVLDTSAITFTKARATQAAASLAYYTFFSIFPLMLVFILVGSYFIDRQNMLQRVTQAVQGILPISQQFIVQSLQQVLKQRTAVGIFVIVSLLWSASNMFNNLASDINKAWPEARERNILQSRLIGLDMLLGLSVLLILSVLLDSATKWLSGFGGPVLPYIGLNIWAVLSGFGSWVAVFFLYLATYRWVPTIRVPWQASAWGALVASIGWKASTTGFAWYLSSPFARYQLVYGSLSAIMAFLFLIYIIALVTLYGAHLTAAIDHLYQARSARAIQSERQPLRSPDTSRAIPVTGTPEGDKRQQHDAERDEPEEEQPETEGEPAGDTNDRAEDSPDEGSA